MQKKILIIEDESEIRSDLIKTLSLSNFNTFEAADGMKGIELAKKIKPDLIISDIMMPLVDGYTVLKELQKIPDTAAIPFLFLSAKSDRNDIRFGMNMGADDYIAKPYDLDELLNAIRTRLKKDEAKESLHQKKFEKLSSNINRSMPHEIRTPLALILGYSDFLIKKFDETTPIEALDMLRNIKDAGQRLHRLYENYLFYLKLETIANDKNELEQIKAKKTFFPELLIKDISLQLAQNYDRQSDLSLDLSDTSIQISEDLFMKVISEIVDNCFKFSEAGTQVEISSSLSSKYYSISFTDYGRGMTQEQIDSIGIFMQFDRSIYEQQGCGLGLAIVRKIISIIDGEFYIKCKESNYTTVMIRLKRVIEK